ncbi:MAG TPA: exodeoxyribonuclease VII large subunit, partial [Dehalococcoidia bacterium]|nr:exodeoxyribonuclease VII large subunit [Dehalococcoidia bacterium]
QVDRHAARLNRALPRTDALALQLTRLVRSTSLCVDRATAHASSRIESLQSRVGALSPQATLERGYAVVQSFGRALRSPKGVSTGSPLAIRLAEGDLDAVAGKGSLVRRRRTPRPSAAQASLPLEAQ